MADAGDLIDLRSPAPVLAHPIRVTEENGAPGGAEDAAAVAKKLQVDDAGDLDDGGAFSFVPSAAPLLSRPPPVANKRAPLEPVSSLIDDLMPAEDQAGACSSAAVPGARSSTAANASGAELIEVPMADLLLGDEAGQQQQEEAARRDAAADTEQPAADVDIIADEADAAAPSSSPALWEGFAPPAAAPPPVLSPAATLSPWRAPTTTRRSLDAPAAAGDTPPRVGARAASQPQPASPAPPPPHETTAAEAPAAAAQQPPANKQVEELLLKLSKAEACREALAREVGQHKAIISKMEGSKSSYEKQLRQAEEEKADLRAQLAAARQEAAAAKVAAGVTPERCRVSARALTEEAQRAEQGRQQKEAELLQAKALLEYEVQEMKSLKDFMSQERLSLLAVSEGQARQLAEAQEALGQARARAKELEGKLAASQDELQQARREVWVLNNASIELKAELAAVRSQAAAAHDGATAAQQQLANESEGRQRAEGELREVRAAGVALYKQIRAVSHALEGNMQVFQAIPRVALSIRQLQEWCAKKAAYWGAQSTAASEADAAAASSAAAATEPGHSVVVVTAHGTSAEAPALSSCGAVDAADGVTLSIAQLFARPTGGSSGAATSSLAAPDTAAKGAVPGSVLKRTAAAP